ncbi:thyroid transcription factor 1-associated protein 26 [Sitophilus oryzae]|uniref:Thyroid transcription factor 1-associated protein 26 n=1 Tax=Sitophilus oryzae TaxID=7048 RepID=A0A6J2XFD8_SITOR|nr:thyroid transcription factor 1-associated protein 26 [Sitophilus oryzae]
MAPRNKNIHKEVNEVTKKKNDGFFIKSNKRTKRDLGKRGQNFKKSDDQKRNESKKDKETEKKPFDKKTYRLKKYSNKYKIQQWENQRKHAVVQRYQKSMKKDNSQKFDVEKIYKEYENDEESDDETKDLSNNEYKEENKNKKKLKLKPQEKFEQMKSDAETRRAEALKRKEMKEQAIKEYKKKKLEKFKKLNKKTKRGQPVMKDRIELLLEEIQQSVNKG